MKVLALLLTLALGACATVAKDLRKDPEARVTVTLWKGAGGLFFGSPGLYELAARLEKECSVATKVYAQIFSPELSDKTTNVLIGHSAGALRALEIASEFPGQIPLVVTYDPPIGEWYLSKNVTTGINYRQPTPPFGSGTVSGSENKTYFRHSHLSIVRDGDLHNEIISKVCAL